MDGGYFWAGGRSAVDRLFITAGPMLRIKNRLSVFACMGYGASNLFWEDFQGKWAEVADASHHGVCAEAGAEWQFSRCFAGASLISLYLQYEIFLYCCNVLFNIGFLRTADAADQKRPDH